jgi:thiamine-phosphate pyrophosphorylase
MSPAVSPTRARRRALLERVDLYPVVGAAHAAGRSTESVVAAVVAAGCGIVQLREKDLSKRALLALARRVRALVPADVLLLVDDQLDVALAAGADGVHLGREDLPLAAARALAPDLLLGASSHDRAEAEAAVAAGADYVNIGPIFPTRTKAGASGFLGPQAVAAIGPRLSVPFTVMGGIHAGNIDAVLAAGARRVAVVTAVTRAPDPRRAAEALRRRIRAGAGRP